MSLNIFKQPSVQDLVNDIYSRKVIANQLVRLINLLYAETRQGGEREVTGGETVNKFCETLEAIFLHGLKERFTSQFASLVFGGSMQAGVPNLDFLGVAALVTHEKVMLDIDDLKAIRTNVGKCRVWIRSALNDGILFSLMDALTKHPKLSSYYRSGAFLRDEETMFIVLPLIERLYKITFVLPLNMTSLNIWSAGPLTLAGQLTNRDEDVAPVIRGVAVEDYFITDSKKKKTKPVKMKVVPNVEKPLSPSLAQEIEDVLGRSGLHPFSDQSRVGLSQSVQTDDLSRSNVSSLLEELKLDKTQGFTQAPACQEVQDRPSLVLPHEIDTEPEVDDVHEEDSMHASVWSNGRLSDNAGWSSAIEDPEEVPKEQPETQPGVPETPEASDPKPAESQKSFDSILRDYTKHIVENEDRLQPTFGTPKLNNFLSNLTGHESDAVPSEASSKTHDNSSDEDLLEGFEIIQKPSKEDERTLQLLEDIGKIPREHGLDHQNFECFGCKCSIGMIFGEYFKCSLDGRLYCTECFKGENGDKPAEHAIPARIVHDWDLKCYPVCRYNKQFLERYEQQALLNIRELNPHLYSVVPELTSIQSLRRQLRFLRLYLFSCSETVSNQLRIMIRLREHLYEHEHLYSTIDLLSIASGSLEKLLTAACQFSTKHVLSCQLCTQKGFICELCSDPKVIYPFNMNGTHFCELCSALYHQSCMELRSNSCVKCERQRKRQEMLSMQEGSTSILDETEAPVADRSGDAAW